MIPGSPPLPFGAVPPSAPYSVYRKIPVILTTVYRGIESYWDGLAKSKSSRNLWNHLKNHSSLGWVLAKTWSCFHWTQEELSDTKSKDSWFNKKMSMSVHLLLLPVRHPSDAKGPIWPWVISCPLQGPCTAMQMMGQEWEVPSEQDPCAHLPISASRKGFEQICINLHTFQQQ